MAESCCASLVPLDQSDAVDARYGVAALEQESCLCTPVGFAPDLFQIIPDAVVAETIGFGNVRFVEGAIEALDEQGDGTKTSGV